MGLRKTEERRGEGVGVGKSRSYVVEQLVVAQCPHQPNKAQSSLPSSASKPTYLPIYLARPASHDLASRGSCITRPGWVWEITKGAVLFLTRHGLRRVGCG